MHLNSKMLITIRLLSTQARLIDSFYPLRHEYI